MWLGSSPTQSEERRNRIELRVGLMASAWGRYRQAQQAESTAEKGCGQPVRAVLEWSLKVVVRLESHLERVVEC